MTDPAASAAGLAPEPEVKYAYAADFQDAILAALLRDPKYARSYGETVAAAYFDGRLRNLVASIALESIQKIAAPPSRAVLVQMLRERRADDADALAFVERLYGLGLGDLPLVRERAIAFGRKTHVVEALIAGAGLIETAEVTDPGGVDVAVSKAVDLVRKAGEFGRGHGGDQHDLLRDANAAVSRRLSGDQEQRLTTGIAGLDAAFGGGIKRAICGAIAGGSGSGKSVVLANVSAANALRGHLVAYASLELSATMIADRIHCRYANLTERDLATSAGAALALRAMERVRRRGGNVVIKAFPSRVTSVGDLRAWVSRVEDEQGRTVDLLVVDASEHLGPVGTDDHDERWKAQRESLEDLVNWTHTEMLPTSFTAMQYSKEASKKPRDLDISDVKGQERGHDLDFLLLLETPARGEAADPADDDAGPGRGTRHLRVGKSRIGAAGIVVPVRIDYSRYMMVDSLPPAAPLGSAGPIIPL